jgi:hypothetical protein
MRLAPSLLAFLALAAVGGTACRGTPPPPPPPPPAKPVSGWSEQAGRDAARSLMEAATAHAWVARFREINGRMPVIEVAAVDDRSGDQVPVEALQTDLLTVLGASDRVLAAGPGQVADVVLTGRISLTAGVAGRPSWFQVDLRISDRKSGEALWYNGLEVKRVEPLPPPPPAPAPAKG